MSGQGSPDTGAWRGRAIIGRIAVWCVLPLLAIAALSYASWRLLGHIPYRIDIDVYQMGARAWLDNRPLYKDTMFHTPIGLNLPFTYPPLAAIVFCPFAWLRMPAASVAITCTTLALLLVAIMVVLTRLDVWRSSRLLPGPVRWRRWWLALAVVAAAVIWLEPIKSNFAYGQINVVLMTLVIADCLPRRTVLPRGVLLGLGIALKLTPAVFLLYFLLRREGRAALTAVCSFAAATLAGFVLAWRDSREYWTNTVRNTDRIGAATLNTNQNIAGALARSGLGEQERFVLWVLGCLLVLAVTIWATRRVLAAGEPALAVICVALFGLVVSPVSWSHHWVWMLPAVLVTAVLAYRRRSAALAAVSAAGVALMVWTPIDLMPKYHETTAAWWRQLVGASYVWWALAAIVTAGITVTARSAREIATAPDRAPMSAVGWMAADRADQPAAVSGIRAAVPPDSAAGL
ncbi:glycosyltransferase 87 family protein [Mycobacterium sp.]|uniref:glycosyltransferase 87 family protein n=1 Tax=Mycobacterium sp. TaxID=1785 RepID=UPI0039C9D3D2